MELEGSSFLTSSGYFTSSYVEIVVGYAYATSRMELPTLTSTFGLLDVILLGSTSKGPSLTALPEPAEEVCDCLKHFEHRKFVLAVA